MRRAADNYTAPAVLPPYRRLVLDEAHNLEEAATSHLGAALSKLGLLRSLRRLEQQGKGLLPALVRAFSEEDDDLLVQASLRLIHETLIPATDAARERAGVVFGLLEQSFGREAGTHRLDARWTENPVWGSGLDEALPGLLAALDELVRGAEELRARVMVDEAARERQEGRLLELRGLAGRLESAADALRLTLTPGPRAEELVRWLEYTLPRENAPGNLVLCAAPLDLSALLREALWERIPSVVLTSATLATQGNFGFVRERLGLDDGSEAPVREAIFPSSFDHANQMIVVVPTDLPLPGAAPEARHDEATVRGVLAHAEISDGGIFVLFTSYRALHHVASELLARSEGRWPLFVHGEAPRGQLLERFAASGRGILLGTLSFWEGVDVPGNALRGLVIPRLPFRVPSEPVTAARIEAIEAAGGNAFYRYLLPLAAIRLKQGFGRLIRTRDDRGVVLILDGRIAKRRYGGYLRGSLPPASYVAGPWREVREEMERFYGNHL
ncbi:hypothetical protein BH23GEM4_BH23GEM4_24850 [soil metagenome]